MGISREQALDCLRSDDLIGIGMEADAVRRKLHPEGVASYSLECGIDCAGVRAKGGSADFDALCTEIYAQASEALETGATGIVLDELSARATGTGMLESLFLGIKQRYPSIWLQALNAPEINRIAATSGLGARETLMRLRDAGLDAIGAEGMVLADPDGWIEVHRAAHGLGMSTTAAMVFGGGETMEQRVDCLEAVRQLQEGTGGFAAFIPLSFHSSQRTNFGRRDGSGEPEDAGGLAGHAGQHRECAIEQDNARAKGAADGAALRRERRGLSDARRERQRGRSAANHPRRRLRAGKARFAVSDDVPELDL